MNKNLNRREFVKAAGTAAVALALPAGCQQNTTAKYGPNKDKKHIVTISFDDGYEKSSIRQAEIYEKYNLSACINVIASGHLRKFKSPGKWPNTRKGDFVLWNELKERGHEIMPHSYKHANLKSVPYNQAKDLIIRCLDYFAEKLDGFDAMKSIYNFAYNASTAELEAWLSTKVKAFRTAGGGIDPMPYKGQVKLTCTGPGRGNCEKHLDNWIEKLLAKESGWLIYNGHGLDGQGWGPMRAEYLDKLLERLLNIDSVAVLPVAPALATV